MTKAVTKAQANSLADASSSFEEFAGSGLENVGADDLLVPRLGILQALSPQLKKQKSEFIEGAEEGDICDLGTGDIYKDGIWFLPVFYRKEYLEWAPRDSGKGLVNIHSDPAILDQTTRDDRRRAVLPNGNYIADTAQFYGLNLSDGRRMSYIPMTSTQLKKARRWNTLAMGEKLRRADGSEFTAPLWYRTYKLTTAPESNNDGDWYGWVINRDLSLPEIDREGHQMDWRAIKEEVVRFQEQLVKGEAKADTSGIGDDVGGSDGGRM
jgi:hypothetical protein